MGTHALFLPVTQGQRFCLFHPAHVASRLSVRGQVVYIHPFAEEMNKSRHMAALQARALAQAGFDVIQIDLLGCGDSSGDFGDATWIDWVDDVKVACEWLRLQLENVTAISVQRPPLWLWGLRSGCLVAAQTANALAEPCNFLFWAPTPSGKLVLQQFLRLKAAGDLASGNARAVMNGLRDALNQGRPVEIGGYLLAPDLANGLAHAALSPPKPVAKTGRVEWIELTSSDECALTPVATAAISQWRESGHAVRSYVIRGPAFWQTSEIIDNPGLVGATTSAILQ